MNRQLRFAGIVVGDDGARLERYRGMAAEMKDILDLDGAVLESRLDISAFHFEREGQIGSEIGIDDLRAFLARKIYIGHHAEFFIGDFDELGGVFRQRPRLRDHGDDGLSGPNHFVGG
jgi:hypothetical protein